MNLIPPDSVSTGDYWCTWRTQGEILNGDQDRIEALNSRDSMSEKFIFGKYGIGDTHFEKIKQDIYILLDDGWDVPYGTPSPEMRWRFGSMELNEKRCPSFTGVPRERLKQLCLAIRQRGFKGTGLWVALQCMGERKDLRVDDESFRNYWAERAEWCEYAGISYWKVDWGEHCCEARYRRMLTDIVRRHAPHLEIEHAYPNMPINEEGAERHKQWYIRRLNDILQIAGYCDYFRTYDVVDEFAKPTTIDRVGELLSADVHPQNGRSVLNIEDEPYIGAALGFSIGIMRHTQWPARNDFPADLSHRWNEVERAVRWHRVAPPFGLGESTSFVTEERLSNSWTFTTDPDCWPFVGGKTIIQTAPAAISRHAPLPRAKGAGQELPYVLTSIHPQTGACSVATFARTFENRFWETPLADVCITAGSVDKPVGIFGDYQSLTIRFEAPVGSKKVYVQDLCDETAYDISSEVVLTGSTLYLSGAVITKYGELAQATEDVSPAGLILQLFE